ncbi:MAG: DUF1292 domain-containing protein [Bacillales bacterium]|nr:DUF1292 domain-containing protein [Bacillales bacterium]
MEKDTIKIIDENGQEKVVDIVAFFTLKSNRKKYLIYTENKKDEKGNVEIYTSELTENDKGAIILAGVEDEMVWNDIKQVLVNISKGLF